MENNASPPSDGSLRVELDTTEATADAEATKKRKICAQVQCTSAQVHKCSVEKALIDIAYARSCALDTVFPSDSSDSEEKCSAEAQFTHEKYYPGVLGNLKINAAYKKKIRKKENVSEEEDETDDKEYLSEALEAERVSERNALRRMFKSQLSSTEKKAAIKSELSTVQRHGQMSERALSDMERDETNLQMAKDDTTRKASALSLLQHVRRYTEQQSEVKASVADVERMNQSPLSEAEEQAAVKDELCAELERNQPALRHMEQEPLLMAKSTRVVACTQSATAERATQVTVQQPSLSHAMEEAVETALTAMTRGGESIRPPQAKEKATTESGMSAVKSMFDAPVGRSKMFLALCRVIRLREQIISILRVKHRAENCISRLSSMFIDFKDSFTQKAGSKKTRYSVIIPFQRIHLSGSVREGAEVGVSGKPSGVRLDQFLLEPDEQTGVAVCGERAHPPRFEQASDVDVMVQLGPCTVMRESPRVLQGSDYPFMYVVMPSHQPRLDYAKSLCWEPLKLDLWQFLQGKCEEEQGMEFGNPSGPAIRIKLENNAIDVVPCVVCPVWEFVDFEKRERPSGQPSADLVERLCRMPAFLVMTETWRLSFSRQESAVLQSMSKTQRTCLTMLKHCNVIMGSHLQSYDLKTAMMWVCETRPQHLWTWDGMQESMEAVLDFLQDCAERGRLPSYFQPKTSLWHSEHESKAFRMLVPKLKARLLRAIQLLLAGLLSSSQGRLMQHLLGYRMSAQQFLRCYWKHTLKHFQRYEPLVEYGYYPQAVEGRLWSDGFLEPFEWEKLPPRCKEPNWFADHGLDTDSEGEEESDDSWDANSGDNESQEGSEDSSDAYSDVCEYEEESEDSYTRNMREEEEEDM